MIKSIQVNELVSYYEQLAELHTSINHSTAHQKFLTYHLKDINEKDELELRQRTVNFDTPVMLLSVGDFDLIDYQSKNKRLFVPMSVVICKKTPINDYKAEEATYYDCFLIACDLLKRMERDFASGSNVSFKADTVQFSKLPMFPSKNEVSCVMNFTLDVGKNDCFSRRGYFKDEP
jgi:hypothetical protein